MRRILLNELFPVVHYSAVVRPGESSCTAWKKRTFIDWQIQMAVAGGIRYEFGDGDDFVLAPGEIALVEPGIEISQTLTERETSFCCVHFLFAETAESEPVQLPPRRLKLAEPELFHALFLRLHKAFRTPGNIGEALASGIVRELFLRMLLSESVRGNGADPVKRMTAYLNEHLLERPGRMELARKFHFAPEYVNQLFRKQLGMTPGEYVRRRLAHRAYRLLAGEGLSEKETADRLGFSSPFYFSRVFRAVYGVPPSRV